MPAMLNISNAVSGESVGQTAQAEKRTSRDRLTAPLYKSDPLYKNDAETEDTRVIGTTHKVHGGRWYIKKNCRPQSDRQETTTPHQTLSWRNTHVQTLPESIAPYDEGHSPDGGAMIRPTLAQHTRGETALWQRSFSKSNVTSSREARGVRIEICLSSERQSGSWREICPFHPMGGRHTSGSNRKVKSTTADIWRALMLKI